MKKFVWKGGDGDLHHYYNRHMEYATCRCFFEDQKCNKGNRCNCDATDRFTRSDAFVVTNKNHLPILEIKSMDVSSAEGKSGSVFIGPLVCEGISGDHNSVTFQDIFSYLPLPNVNFGNPGSIEFEFKTNRAQGNVMIFAQVRNFIIFYM